jgi:hypothetical protein
MKKMKLAFAAVAFAMAGLANATVITVSTTGTIDSGKDTLGLFGTPGGDLAGLPYVLTVTTGFDSPDRYYTFPNGSFGATREPFVAAVTVEGRRYAYLIVQANQTDLSMRLPISGNSGITFAAVGRDDAGTLIAVNQIVSQDIFTDTLTDYLNVPVQGTSSIVLQVGTSQGSTIFRDSDPPTFVLNGDPATLTPPAPPVSDPTPPSGLTPVPEPTSAMLFGAGLLGFATLRRRQSRR